MRDRLLELNGLDRLPMVKTKMDHRICRGIYLSARNQEHRLVQQCGGHVIIIARDLPKEWERFIYIKEAMHTFDDPEEAADSGDKFDNLLNELTGSGSPGPWSKPMTSEIKSFWMALGVLCPEAKREEYAEDRDQGHIDDYEISLRLKIPERYVTTLFQANWLQIIASLTE